MRRKVPTEHESGFLEYLKDIIGTSKYKGGVGEDSPPPVKKSRPSPEVEDSEVSDNDDDIYAEEEPATKPKGRKSAAKKGKDDD